MPVKSLQSLERGLDILELVNRRPGTGIDDISAELRIKRGTTYRILETLRREGYLCRDQRRGRYLPGDRVNALSEGYRATGWLQDDARPILQSLSKKFLWPTSIAVPMGCDMVLRATTDDQTPYVKNRHSIGSCRPIIFTSTGLAYLAHCSPYHREAIYKMLRQKPNSRYLLKPAKLKELELVLRGVRKKGYAVFEHPDNVTQLAVPIFKKNLVIAGLSIRYFRSMIGVEAAASRFCSALRDAASKIGRLAPN